MDTESLRLFVRASEIRNISAAGKELGMAPAVASARLAKLERSLGADLLHRTTRKVSLSTEGAEFLPFAMEMLAQERAGRAALGMGSAEPGGNLRFTAPATFAQLYIAPLLAQFLDRYPAIRLDLHLSDAQFDLIAGSYDLALRNSPVEDSSFRGRLLADDVRILCASPAYLEKAGTPEQPEDLAGHRLVAFRHRTQRRLLAGDGREGVFDPDQSNCRLVVDDGLSQKLASLNGAGVSINSLWSVHGELRDGSLVRVLPDYRVEDESRLWLVYPKSNVLTDKVRVFIDFMLEQIGDSPPWLQD